MERPLKYAPMSAFPLRWRFAEAPRWAVLPEADLRQLRPLSEPCSRDRWHRLVTPAATHLLAAGESGPRFEARVAEYRTADDWTAEEEAARAGEFLRRHIPIREDAGLLFFWDASCAAETTWDILLRYWSDFCYPSDNSNVVVPVEGDRLVVYVEGLVWVAPRVAN
jgi:hypothetical protein